MRECEVYMNQFKMYVGQKGDIKAVKNGWCWTGFLFTYAWGAISKLWSLSLFSFMLHFTLLIFMVTAEANLEIVFNFTAGVWLVVKFFFGLKGNELYEKALLESGYELNDTIFCINAENAVYQFQSKQTAA